MALDLTPPAEPLTGYYHPDLGEESYDFYRCKRCTRLVTQPQMIRGLRNPAGADVCPCGGLQFSPTNPTPGEYFLPRVLAFAWTRILEKVRRGGA